MTEVEDSTLESVRVLLEVVCDGMGLDAEIEVYAEDEVIYASLEGEDLGLFIGKHGQTIDAVQHLAYKVAGRIQSPTPAVMVDAAGYRKKRESVLFHQADKAAASALKEDKPVEMDPMSAVDRKVVHEHLKTKDGIETYSEGEEPNRRLVIAPLKSE